jgi:membrane protease YdiL (CAAX protease family)
MVKKLIKTISIWVLLILILIVLIVASTYLFGLEANILNLNICIDLSLIIVVFSYLIYHKIDLLKEIQKITIVDALFCSLIVLLFSLVVEFYNFPHLISTLKIKQINFSTNFELNKMFNLSTYEILRMLILMPILEEILYRNILLKRYSSFLHYSISIIITSVMFSLFHFDPNNFIGIFLAGIILGTIFHYTKNLILVIYSHSIYNLLILTLTNSERNIKFEFGILLIIFANILIISLLYFFSKRNSKKLA